MSLSRSINEPKAKPINSVPAAPKRSGPKGIMPNSVPSSTMKKMLSHIFPSKIANTLEYFRHFPPKFHVKGTFFNDHQWHRYCLSPFRQGPPTPSSGTSHRKRS